MINSIQSLSEALAEKINQSQSSQNQIPDSEIYNRI